jgi:hypothetical protein
MRKPGGIGRSAARLGRVLGVLVSAVVVSSVLVYAHSYLSKIAFGSGHCQT